MKIRTFEPQDIPKLALFMAHLETALWAKDQDMSEMIHALGDRLQDMTDSSTLLLAENEDHDILGYCAIHWVPNLVLAGPEGYLSELFVAQNHRGKGIGDSLLTQAERLAIEKGCCRMFLINLREKESYQRAFYLKRAWHERENAANMVKEFRRPNHPFTSVE